MHPPSVEANEAKKIRIFASPSRRNVNANPYNYLLSEALSAAGCEVDEFRFLNAITRKADVLHIHWPQAAADGNSIFAIYKIGKFLARVTIQRLRGAVIIWTVHNVDAHSQKNIVLERFLMRCFLSMVSGVIYISKSSIQLAEERYKELRGKHSTYIPHGFYGSIYVPTNNRKEVREELGIAEEVTVIGFFGDIRPYKGLHVLLELKDLSNVCLLIAGYLNEEDAYGRDIVRKIGKLRQAGHQVIFINKRLTNSELVNAIRAVDFVAMPYIKIANSGLALLALEHRARLLASDQPIFREMAAELGGDRVCFLDEQPRLENLKRSPQAETCRFEQFRDARDWSNIAAKTISFYRKCMSESSGSKP